MYILGINAYHADSSAALLKDGHILYATEEERFTRKKHWAGMPMKSIKFCLESAGIDIRQLDAVCIGRDPKAKMDRKLLYTLKNPLDTIGLVTNRFKNRSDLQNIEALFLQEFSYCPPIKFIEHHRAHLASAFFSSPFDEAAIVSIDGSGDFSTVMIGHGIGSRINVIESQDFPVSIGLLYTAFTQFLGFPYYGDEYKVMGLSPYGEPSYVEDIRKIVWPGKKQILEWDSSFFNIKDGVIKCFSNEPIPSTLFVKSKFERIFGVARIKNEHIDKRHKDIACSLQRVTEELIFSIVEKAYKLTGSLNITFAGGVAQNSVANGKIIKNTSFDNLYIPSAGHDAGIAMGSAQYYYFNELNQPRVEALYNANLGIQFDNQQIGEKLKELNLEFRFLEDDLLFQYLAKKIASEKVIGFFDGAAEFGPRALGSRSIVADPRNPRAQALLNEKIKKRESSIVNIIEDFKRISGSFMKLYCCLYCIY